MNIAGQNHRSIDIETAPKSIEELLAHKPEFSAPANYKDPEKIRANIAEQEANWLAKAALSPLTGRVLVIGLGFFGAQPPVVLEGNERDILLELWQIIGTGREFDKWHGHNIAFFDIPFLVKRSWSLGIEVPMGILFNNGRLNDRRFVDTMATFQCGNRQDFVSLHDAAIFLGHPDGKKDSVSEHFSEIYATDRPRAIAHLHKDLHLVEFIATRMYSYPIAA